jgi:hypothetical protein
VIRAKLPAGVASVASVLLLQLAASASAAAPAGPGQPAAAAPPPAIQAETPQGHGGPAAAAEADDYTRYELLAPDSAQFRILYEVTATRPGATAYFNPIRKGSEASGESVRDRASGRSLELAVVSGGRRGGAACRTPSSP